MEEFNYSEEEKKGLFFFKKKDLESALKEMFNLKKNNQGFKVQELNLEPIPSNYKTLEISEKIEYLNKYILTILEKTLPQILKGYIDNGIANDLCFPISLRSDGKEKLLEGYNNKSNGEKIQSIEAFRKILSLKFRNAQHFFPEHGNSKEQNKKEIEKSPFYIS